MSSEEEAWHEKDEFWEDNPFPQRVIDHAEEEVKELIDLADLKEDMKVLDLCCGVGRHTIEFAKRGFDVTGVDKTDNYLEKARERAEEDSLDIEFIKEDMRKFKRAEEYDLILNLFTSFGYFEDEEENIKVLENVHTTLKTGGKFILDVMGKEIIARIFEGKDWHEIEKGYQLEEKHVEKDWSWLMNKRTIITEDGKREYDVSHRLYSAKELKHMLEKVGFDTIEVYGNYSGEPYDEKADRLVVIAEK